MKEYLFHTFSMGDVEDPEIYAAMPIMDWQGTEKGQWVMEHCKNPQYRFRSDPQSWGHQCEVFGSLDDRAAVAFILKWGHVKA